MSITDFRAWRMEILVHLKKYIRLKRIWEIPIIQVRYPFFEKTKLGRLPVLHVERYQDIVKIIGEIKSYFSDRNIRILLRGQQNHHSFIQLPKIFRLFNYSNLLTEEILQTFERSSEHTSPWLEAISHTHFIEEKEKKELKEKIKLLKTNLDLFYDSTLPATIAISNMIAWESILQHYDYSTRYLDLVDNLPLALWFASHDLKTKTQSKNEYGYIFVYGILVVSKIARGVWDGPFQRLVNLVEATNPHALRPHMQYAFSLIDNDALEFSTQNLEFIDKFINRLTTCDYAKYLLCVLQIRVTDIMEWLGVKNKEGILILPEHLKYSTLFPKNDNFLKELKEWEKKSQKESTRRSVVKVYEKD